MPDGGIYQALYLLSLIGVLLSLFEPEQCEIEGWFTKLTERCVIPRQMNSHYY